MAGVKRIGNNDGARNLRAFIEAMHQLPYVCTITAALVVLPSLITRDEVPAFVLISAGVIVIGAWGARLWYRVNSDSVRALLLLNTVGSVMVVEGFLLAMWEMRLFSDLQGLFTGYLPYYVAVFVSVWGGMALRLIKRGVHLHEMYENLRACLLRGGISDYQLGRLLSPGGTSVAGVMLKTALAGGVAISGTMLAGALGGRDAVGYLYFLVFLLLAPLVLGIATARAWAYRKYLQWRDLKIIWT